MSSVILRKQNPALQRIAIYAAIIAAFAMIIGVSLGLGQARADIPALSSQYSIGNTPHSIWK